MNKIYVMPEELRSATKISANFYFFDLIFIVSWVLVFIMIGAIFHVPEDLSLYYNVWNIIAAIILTCPSPRNPEKRMYYAFLFYFMKDRKVYHPVFTNERSRQDEEFKKEYEAYRKEIL